MLSLMEAALVNYLSAQQDAKPTATPSNKLAPEAKLTRAEAERRATDRKEKISRRYHKISRALFPALFGLFNLFYWWNYAWRQD